MNRETIVVTGASGFVGGEIARTLCRGGYCVEGWSRRSGSIEGVKWRPFDLADCCAVHFPSDCRALVHAAYDFSLQDWESIRRVNVANTLKLFQEAVKARVRLLIFISSMSAYPGCRSKYGRAKMLVEDDLRPHGAIIVRPGLVYDEEAREGIYGGLRRLARRLPIIPLVGSGNYPQYLVHKRDLAEFILEVIQSERLHNKDRPFLACHAEPMSLKQLMQALSRHRDSTRPAGANTAATGTDARVKPCLPIPWPLVYLALRMGEAFGLPVGLRSDSVIGLVYPNPRPDFDPEIRFRPYPTMESPSRRECERRSG
jgi:nucleoside-diphosphate-sugar epimerase